MAIIWRRAAGPSVPPRYPQLSPRYLAFLRGHANPSARTAPGDVTRGVVLKAVLKKKVKGNEVRVLQGLNHHNAVRHFSTPLFMMRLRAHVLVCLLTCLVVFL